MTRLFLTTTALAGTFILGGCVTEFPMNTSRPVVQLTTEEAVLAPKVIGGKDDFRAGDEPPANPSEVVIRSRKAEGADKIPEIRRSAVADGAMTYGSRKGYQRRSWEITKILEDRGPVLSQVYDFTRVVDHAPGGAGIVVPPIVSFGTRAFTVDAKGQEAAVADAYLTIVKPGRLARTAPIWQEYLAFTSPDPEEPARSLLPVNDEEANLFRRKFNEGWAQGRKLADDELEARLARLQRDYHGMLQYRKLVADNMMDRMVLSNADFGVTSGNDEMRIGSRVVKITSQAQFQKNPSRWSVKSLTERDALVASGVNLDLGDMLSD